MAYRIAWSIIARDDLKDIIRYISSDSPKIAVSFAARLIKKTDLLETSPEIGRIVPERRDPLIREIIFRPYRIVYRLNYNARTVEIARIWHSARATPDLPET